VDTPLISLANEKRAGYKMLLDLGFVINVAAGVGGLAGLVFGAVLIVHTHRYAGIDTNHPTVGLGVFVLVVTILTCLVLVAAGRVVLALGRIGLRALREE
jgi:hypothetical protein